jgi:tetratricopeptide (TPR) repeat protein
MRADEPETNFKSVEACLRQADFEFKQPRYELAAPLYQQALEILHQTRATGHADVLYCLQNLADSWTFSGDYKKAYETLQELLELRQRQPGVNNVDLIATKFKVAKVLEMGRTNQLSANMYDDAMNMAEQSLYTGHPLLIAIYVAYKEMLQRTAGAPELIEALTKKSERVAGADQGVGADILDSMRLRDYVALVAPEPPPEPEPVPEPIKLPIALIRNVCIGIVLLGAIGAAVVFGTQHHEKHAEQQKQQSMAKTYEGQIFESADGEQKLVFLAGGNVDSVLDGIKRKLPMKVLPPGSEFSSGGNIEHSRSFKHVNDSLMADDGRILYSENASEGKIVARVKTIAKAAQTYFDEHKEYPKQAAELSNIDPKILDNPFTQANDEISVIEAGKERDWTPDQEPDIVPTLESGKLIAGERTLAPGAVHCYLFYTGDKYVEGVKCLGFFIRACDANGKFLAGEPGKAFVAQMIAGREPHIAGIFTAKPAKDADPTVSLLKIISDK